MRNKDIRELIKKKRVFHYEVAEALGVTVTTFSKWLQRELPEEKKNLIRSAVEKILKED